MPGMNVDDIIKAFGGPTELAHALGKRFPARISDWRRRGAVPAADWVALIAEADKRGIPGITLETLDELHRQKSRQHSPEHA